MQAQTRHGGVVVYLAAVFLDWHYFVDQHAADTVHSSSGEKLDWYSCHLAPSECVCSWLRTKQGLGSVQAHSFDVGFGIRHMDCKDQQSCSRWNLAHLLLEV
jgi:hypothetical protein